MKILILKSSILFLIIKPKEDFVKTYFIFFINWNCFKTNKLSFDLAILNLVGIKQFYVNLADEWDRKYRV